jgi:hypothetical protein
MGLGQPDVTGPAQATAPDALRVRALDPGPSCVLGFERGGLLALPRGLERLVVRLRPDRELAGGFFGPGAGLADRAGAAGRGIKADAHDGIAGAIPSRGPFNTGIALGAAGLFRRPIDLEGAQIIALAHPPLMAIGPKGWADDIDLMLCLGGDE